MNFRTTPAPLVKPVNDDSIVSVSAVLHPARNDSIEWSILVRTAKGRHTRIPRSAVGSHESICFQIGESLLDSRNINLPAWEARR